MSPQTKNELRMLLAFALTLVAVFMGYVTLTEPMIVTTGPAIITVAASVGAYFTWRGGKKT